MAESTPLLVDVDDNATHIGNNNEDFETHTRVRDEHVPASAHFHQIIKNLTAVILVASVLAVLILIANYVIITIGPFRWYIGRAQVCTVGLGIIVRTVLPSTSPPPPAFHQIIPIDIK